MYTQVRSKTFEKSYRTLKKGGIAPKKLEVIEQTIDLLASGQPLPAKYRDHQLKGGLSAFRECHIQYDLLLVYEIREAELVLLLIDIGSHTYLF